MHPFKSSNWEEMAQVELIMPKMGESIMEATILKWSKSIGDHIALDETILEIATDKVDSEIPSPVEGVLAKILYEENAVVEVGKVIAIIATEGESTAPAASPAVETPQVAEPELSQNGHENTPEPAAPQPTTSPTRERVLESVSTGESDRFYSPLVRNIAGKEGIPVAELDTIAGSGLNGRVTKRDILAYIKTRTSAPAPKAAASPSKPATAGSSATPAPVDGNVEIIEMDRMRKLIADHMVMSMQTSPHVTSFVEVDVTNLVNWRNKVKKSFEEKHGQKITFTPIFIEAVAKSIRDFPMINISVDGDRILRKKDINIGMATALPSGNLIVPVIHNADSLNLVGLTKNVNDLAQRARANNLKPDDIQGGTFTLTNVGTFGNVMGTPIINQPQVAIMAAGAIRKKPAVVETEYGDLIAIRHMMFLSLSYDHRVVDGFLGGSFLRRVGDYLEAFDTTQQI